MKDGGRGLGSGPAQCAWGPWEEGDWRDTPREFLEFLAEERPALPAYPEDPARSWPDLGVGSLHERLGTNWVSSWRRRGGFRLAPGQCHPWHRPDRVQQSSGWCPRDSQVVSDGARAWWALWDTNPLCTWCGNSISSKQMRRGRKLSWQVAMGQLRICSPFCCRVYCPECYRSRGQWMMTVLEGPVSLRCSP